MSSAAPTRKICKRSTKAAGVDRSKASVALDLNLLPAGHSAPEAAPAPAGVLPNAGSHVSPIDLEGADDEVQLLSNPRNFPKARSRRRTQIAVDVEATGATVGSETSSSTVRQKKHGKFHPNGLVINCDEEDLGGKCCKKASTAAPEVVVLPAQPIVKVVYREPSFTCPVCWNELTEASSTICGHIFCADCIKLSIQKRKECPTCRRKLSICNFHRVFLPNST